MTYQLKTAIMLANLSENIEAGCELAFRRVRPDENFDEYLSSLRSDGADIEELNDMCEQALLHEDPLDAEHRARIVAAHRAFNSVLRLEGRGSRLRLAQLVRQVEAEVVNDEPTAPDASTAAADQSNDWPNLTPSRVVPTPYFYPWHRYVGPRTAAPFRQGHSHE